MAATTTTNAFKLYNIQRIQCSSFSLFLSVSEVVDHYLAGLFLCVIIHISVSTLQADMVNSFYLSYAMASSNKHFSHVNYGTNCNLTSTLLLFPLPSHSLSRYFSTSTSAVHLSYDSFNRHWNTSMVALQFSCSVWRQIYSPYSCTHISAHLRRPHFSPMANASMKRVGINCRLFYKNISFI